MMMEIRETFIRSLLDNFKSSLSQLRDNGILQSFDLQYELCNMKNVCEGREFILYIGNLIDTLRNEFNRHKLEFENKISGECDSDWDAEESGLALDLDMCSANPTTTDNVEVHGTVASLENLKNKDVKEVKSSCNPSNIIIVVGPPEKDVPTIAREPYQCYTFDLNEVGELMEKFDNQPPETEPILNPSIEAKNGCEDVFLPNITHLSANNNLFCRLCGESFMFEAQLDFHYKQHNTLVQPEASTNLNLNKLLEEYKPSAVMGSTFKCSYCGKLFPDEDTFNSHQLLHKSDKRFECSICNKKFAHKHSLDNHIANHTGNLNFPCTECNKVYPSQSKLNAHFLKHREPRFSCDICDKKFYSRSTFDTHRETHNHIKNYTCSQCGAGFKSLLYLKRHVQRHESGKGFSCMLCGLAYKTNRSLQVHMKRHESQEVRMCPVKSCKSQRGFLTTEDLNAHLRVHKHKFLCAKCGQHFGYKHHLVDHEKMKHPNQTDVIVRHSCHLCSRSFLQKRRLQLHLKSHVQHSDFKCTICGMKFYRQDVLNNHVYLHTEQRPYSCAQCGKAFASKSNLTSHLKKHTPISGETHPFKCQLCGAQYKMKSSYNFHMKTHQGNFSFECNVCNKKFVRKSHFVEHLRTHDNLRPHVCPTCGKTYKEIKHCRSHVRRIHPNEFNLEKLVASITPEDARMAEILCGDPTPCVQNTTDMLPIGDMGVILPIGSNGTGEQCTFL